jgi:hypothetical protein
MEESSVEQLSRYHFDAFEQETTKRLENIKPNIIPFRIV